MVLVVVIRVVGIVVENLWWCWGNCGCDGGDSLFIGDTELLRVEVVRSHGCAIFLRICATFLLLNAKQEKKAFKAHSYVQNCQSSNLAA